jgi:hypothetical protein
MFRRDARAVRGIKEEKEGGAIKRKKENEVADRGWRSCNRAQGEK